MTCETATASVPSQKKPSPWRWIPSLYFSQAIPAALITAVSIILYKDRGITNEEVAFWTAWLSLPWVIKGLWGPMVEIFGTRRQWIIATQFLMGIGFALIGLLLPLPFWFMATLIFFWLLAFASATHDVAADGFYMDALPQHEQVWFSGIRNTAFRIAMIAVQGGLVIMVGKLENMTGSDPLPIQLSVSASDAECIPPLESVTRALYGSATVYADEKPKVICESPNTLLTLSMTSDTVNRGITAFVSSWNKQDGSRNALQIEAELQTLRAQNDSPFSVRKLTVVPYRLSAPPSENEIVSVRLRYENGDRSIALLAGERHDFTRENWLKPAFALFRYDGPNKANINALYTLQSGNKALCWSIGIFMMAFIYLLFGIYHFFALPRVRQARKKGQTDTLASAFISFFKLKGLFPAIAFILLYRFGEAQLTKITPMFLMDSRNIGGLSLSTYNVGLITGTVGVGCLLAGGILGSFAAARHGLKRWIWPMACAIHLPNIVYVYLAAAQPESTAVVLGCVALEQFGYGFGFAGFMLYMLCFVEDSPQRTTHYALLTGLMALGMMIPGMFSGVIQHALGYEFFFIWIMISTIPGFIVVAFLKIPEKFGMK